MPPAPPGRPRARASSDARFLISGRLYSPPLPGDVTSRAALSHLHNSLLSPLSALSPHPLPRCARSTIVCDTLDSRLLLLATQVHRHGSCACTRLNMPQESRMRRCRMGPPQASCLRPACLHGAAARARDHARLGSGLAQPRLSRAPRGSAGDSAAHPQQSSIDRTQGL